jgi:DNA-binding response OmpR family regulator
MYDEPMGRPAGHVVLVDGDRRRRRRLGDLLSADGLQVDAAQPGPALASALTSTEPVADVVAVSFDGSADSLVQAVKAAVQGRTNRARLVVIASATLSAELKTKLIEAGASDVIGRDESVEAMAHVIRARIFADRRVAARWPLQVRATVTFEDKKVRGSTLDISIKGAMVRVSSTDPIPVGSTVDLVFELERQVAVRCLVRRSQMTRRFMSKAQELGVEFLAEGANEVLAVIEDWRRKVEFLSKVVPPF